MSHSSEEVLQLKKEIARCQVEAEKMRIAIAQNKVCVFQLIAPCTQHTIWTAGCGIDAKVHAVRKVMNLLPHEEVVCRTSELQRDVVPPILSLMLDNQSEVNSTHMWLSDWML